MLASADVARQLPGVVERLRDRLAAMLGTLEAAREAMRGWSANPGAADEAIERAMAASPRPYALSLEMPLEGSRAAQPFIPCTVVAADGSTIPVDRYGPVPCYAVNTGSVALPYGIDGDPQLFARATVGPPGAGERDPDVSAGGLDLLRDVFELEATAELSLKRSDAGPVVALLDGTLLPWDLDSPQVDVLARQALRDRTAAALDRLQRIPALSLGAYVSASQAADVVTSLRCLAGPQERWPESDGLLFRSILGPGERSAAFRARSERRRRVEQQFSADQQVCFFYLRVGDDVARVELPYWATDSPRLARLHAALLDQCGRCGGYPRALQEAHEQAVISGADRDLFERLLEKQALRFGVTAMAAGKAASKRRRAV